MKLRSYSKIYSLGHHYLEELLLDDVCVSEKIDGCAREGTLVMTPTGDTAIEELKVGNTVITFNHSTNCTEVEVVMGISCKHNNNDWYEVILETGETITLTGNHYVWVEGLQTYRQGKALNQGDVVLLF